LDFWHLIIASYSCSQAEPGNEYKEALPPIFGIEAEPGNESFFPLPSSFFLTSLTSVKSVTESVAELPSSLK